MSISQKSSRFHLPLLVQGQGQKDVTHNEALVILDAIIHPSVVSRSAAMPEHPQAGTCWLIPDGEDQDWAGTPGALAVWTEGGWRYVDLVEGARAWVQDEQRYVRLGDDGTWVAEPSLSAVADLRAPEGGTVVDEQARETIAALISLLGKK